MIAAMQESFIFEAILHSRGETSIDKTRARKITVEMGYVSRSESGLDFSLSLDGERREPSAPFLTSKS